MVWKPCKMFIYVCMYSPASKSWPFWFYVDNFRPSTRRYADPPLILKSLTQTLTKNKRVLTRGRFPRSRCGVKNAIFDRPFFGFKVEDLPGRVSQNCLYIFSRPRHELKPRLICFLARWRSRAQRAFKEKRVFSRGLLGENRAKGSGRTSRTVYIYI